MTRVATVPLQRVMADSITRTQVQLANSQTQLATGKKANDYAALGTETVRNLSAHSMLARQQSETTVAKRVGTTLNLYDANITSVDTSLTDLHSQILTAVGTGNAAGLGDAVKAAFQQYKNALNASEGGTPLFGGSQTDGSPFQADNLSDLVGLDADDAFADDSVRASARVSEGVDVTYGITASDFGRGLYQAFQTLASIGDISDTPDADQIAKLTDAAGQITDGLKTLRAVNASNGRNQTQVETLATRGDERSVMLTDVISQNEDADLGQVALDITNQQTQLQASYAVFGKLTSLSLVDYLN